MQQKIHIMNNPAEIEQAVAYNTVLPYEIDKTIIPSALQYDKEGVPFVAIYAPQAACVKLNCDDNQISLKKQEDGFWKVQLALTPGFYFVQVQIDGVAVLSPMLPIGFGSSRPYNFLEITPMEGFCLLKDIPHGSVSHEYYFSSATGSYETCLVYTPPDYVKDDQSYPVLYLQHGHGENETSWMWQGKVNFILDNLLAAGKAKPMIVVMNNGMVHMKDSDGSIRIDHHAFEKQLLKDTIPFIEQKYRIRPGRDNHAMAGLSMGSVQTSIITFKHPDIFAWIGLFSGFMQDVITPQNDMHLHQLHKQAQTFNRDTRLFFRGMGRDDQFFSRFLEDDKLCNEWNIKRVRKEYSGKHDWNVWRKCIRDFLQLLFQE